MNTEEKARRYDEALNWMREIYPELHGATKEDAEHFFPELTESEDEKVRKWILEKVQGYASSGIPCSDEIKMADKAIDYLEKQKENIEKEYVFRPLAGTDINTAVLQAIRRANEGDLLVLAFNGAYIPVRKGVDANRIVNIYDAFVEKQKEHQSCPDVPKEKKLGSNFYPSDKNKNLDEIAQDYVDGVKQYNQEPTWDLMQTAVCYGYHLSEEQFEKNRLAHCDAVSKEECDRETDFAMEIIEKEHRHPTFNDAINYGMRLQKQKEQKPLTTEETELNSIAFLEQMGYTCIPPGKEQKPAEKQDYSGLNDLERAILRGFLAAGVENVTGTTIKETAKECLAQIKTAEWSEEDKKILDGIITTLDRLGYTEYCESSRDQDIEEDRLYYKEIQCLKKLKSLGPRQIQNVSDMITPNKKFFQWIYNRLVYVHNENPDVDYMRSFKERIEELSFDKSSWKPSDEQKEALEYVIRDYREDGCNATANYLQEILDHLKNM